MSGRSESFSTNFENNKNCFCSPPVLLPDISNLQDDREQATTRSPTRLDAFSENGDVLKTRLGFPVGISLTTRAVTFHLSQQSIHKSERCFLLLRDVYGAEDQLTSFNMDAAVLSLERQNVLCSYIGVAGLVFFFYDHVLTLADEVKYIWKAKHSLPKFMFLLIRYLVPSSLVLQLYIITTARRSTVSADIFCRTWFNLAVCFGIISIGLGNFLVLLRLWILWKRNRKVIAWTLLLFVTAQAGVIACAVIVLVNVTPSMMYDYNLKMCVLQRRSILGALYFPPAILDGLALLAVIWNALASSGNQFNVIMFCLFSERFGYLLILFLMRLVNLGITLFGPLHFVFLGICFIWAATTVTISRLIIDLRKTTLNPKGSELSPPVSPYNTIFNSESNCSSI